MSITRVASESQVSRMPQLSVSAQQQTQTTTKAKTSTVAKPFEREPELDTAEVSKPRAHGVVRLLAEGHFKGNAAARLAQNFASELEALGIKLDEDDKVEDQPKVAQREPIDTVGDDLLHQLSRLDVVG